MIVPLTSLSRRAFWNSRWWSESKLCHGVESDSRVQTDRPDLESCPQHYVWVHLPTYLPACVYRYVSIYLPTYLCMYLLTYLPTCLSLSYLSVSISHPSVGISVPLSLSVHQTKLHLEGEGLSATPAAALCCSPLARDFHPFCPQATGGTCCRAGVSIT